MCLNSHDVRLSDYVFKSAQKGMSEYGASYTSQDIFTDVFNTVSKLLSYYDLRILEMPCKR